MNSSTSNAEVLRLQYLQAMGIITYYPRLQLPGALPSQACDWSFPEKVERTDPAVAAVAEPMPEPRQSTATRPRESAADLAGTLRHAAWQADEQGIPVEAPIKPTRPLGASRAESAPNKQEQVHPDEALHFQLLLLHVDADLAVVLQIPALGRPQLQDHQRLLLGNLLRWLGKGALLEHTPRVFRWPLPGLTLTNTRREAGASLLHFLEQACVEQPFRHLLLLGEAAAECLQAQHEAAPAQPLAWQLTATHSLDELLALPQLKRAAWQTLLPLHAALASQRPHA